MSREWAPGDVAYMEGVGIVFRYRDFSSGSDEWMSATQGGAYPSPDELRPLAAIDYEDREAVERLFDVVAQWSDRVPYDDMREDGDLTGVTAMQAALREFAAPTPPKSEEPTGHLAVVEDVDGVRWVSWRDPRDGAVAHRRPWQSTAMDADEWRDYADIDAPIVLSEGVPS